MKMVTRETWSYPILFTIKTYQGDVFSAQKAGADAAKPFCTHHVFTEKVASPDNIQGLFMQEFHVVLLFMQILRKMRA